MNKRFRCGRLTLTKNGEVKKVDLGNGGGSRFCEWSDNDMTFNDIHNRLINIFNLGNLINTYLSHFVFIIDLKVTLDTIHRYMIFDFVLYKWVNTRHF
jgi:hypothetical protein